MTLADVKAGDTVIRASKRPAAESRMSLTAARLLAMTEKELVAALGPELLATIAATLDAKGGR